MTRGIMHNTRKIYL